MNAPSVSTRPIRRKRSIVAHDELKREGITARVVDMATVKPLDEEEVRAAAVDTGAIVTAVTPALVGVTPSFAVGMPSTRYPPPPGSRGSSGARMP